MNRIKELIRTCIFFSGRLFCFNKKSKVLYYHDVSTVDGKSYTALSTPYELFDAHMSIVLRYGTIVDEITQPKYQFQIAFDDGFKGVYDNRLYFLEKKIFPTIFVAKDLVGAEGYMDESQIKELSRMGFSIQSHSVSHCDLSGLDEQRLRYELAESKSYLEALLGKEVTGICCPMGYYNDDVIREARKAGYSHIYLSYPEPVDTEKFVRGRYFCQSLTVSQFRLSLYGGMDILKSRYVKQHNKSNK